MISWRRYFAILMIFLVTLLLFQGLQLARIHFSDIHVNKHIGMENLRAEDVRYVEPLSELKLSDSAETGLGPSCLLYVGSLDSPYVETLEEWAVYANKTIYHSETFYPLENGALPDLILLSPDCLAGSAETLEWYTSREVDVICLALPDVQTLYADPHLCSLLGIWKIRQSAVQLGGVHLFSGFFLGGERIYQGKGADDPRQDLELNVPWYVTREKTKTFMCGILTGEEKRKAEEEGLKNEDMPCLIWSSHVNRGEIYCICGDYFMDRQIALGILSAADYERSPYLLYPVVNAEVFSMIDYPIAADENTEQMNAVYGRTMTRFESDIVVPQLQTLASRHDYRASCFMASKFDYDDPAKAKQDFISNYLAILNDTGGELGLNLHYTGSVELKEKVDMDASFYLAEGSEYPVHGVYVDAENLDLALELLPEHPVWKSIGTISLSQAEDLPLLGYLTDSITVQQITSSALTHSFRQDLELLGMETALAYSNASLYMSEAFWPQSEDAEWHNSSRKAFENLGTYYHTPFAAFDRVTISESDARLREFLSYGYALAREGDVLILDLPESYDIASFVLRTHNEDILSISGGDFVQIEDDAFLIDPTENHVEITLYSRLAWLLYPEVGK